MQAKMKTFEDWDELSEEFNTYKEKIFQGAADNIYTVWPIILHYINLNFRENKNNLRALDYGCGTGMFCKELKSLKSDVYGIDISQKMIKIAKKHLGKEIKFLVGDSSKLPQIAKKEGKFNLITSIMVFQFISDIEKCVRHLSDSLSYNGHIIFAVHNPKKLDERNVKDRTSIAGKTLRIYRRTSADYDKIFTNLGFVKTFEKYPKTSRKFLKIYEQKDSIEIPKYMILAYKKKP